MDVIPLCLHATITTYLPTTDNSLTILKSPPVSPFTYLRLAH